MTKPIRVDDYTYELVNEVIKRGLATNFADAINTALANLLGIPYKSREERKLERDLAMVMELSKRATKEEQ